jgi:hypothetical protein
LCATKVRGRGFKSWWESSTSSQVCLGYIGTFPSSHSSLPSALSTLSSTLFPLLSPLSPLPSRLSPPPLTLCPVLSPFSSLPSTLYPLPLALAPRTSPFLLNRFAYPLGPLPLHISPFPSILLRWWAVRHGPINKGMCVEFEQHVRCLMATGATARQTRESLLLSATHFVGGATSHLYPLTVPNTYPLPKFSRSGRRCSLLPGSAPN